MYLLSRNSIPANNNSLWSRIVQGELLGSGEVYGTCDLRDCVGRNFFSSPSSLVSSVPSGLRFTAAQIAGSLLERRSRSRSTMSYRRSFWTSSQATTVVGNGLGIRRSFWTSSQAMTSQMMLLGLEDLFFPTSFNYYYIQC